MHTDHTSLIPSRLRGSRGSVLAVVGIAMFPMLAMLTFAIDVSHWFDYSRNLQNRADAAALAGGQALGACIGSTGTPGTTTNGLQGTAGKFAQLFSGMNLGENAANAPYTDAQVSASQTAAAGSGNGPGTGWVLTGNGYANHMLQPYVNGGNPADPYIGTYSPLDLKAADSANINNFWVALNASDYSPNAGANTSFTMNPAGTPATFCSADPTYDVTDKQCGPLAQPPQPHNQTTGPCQKGPMVDVKLTEKSIPLFIPLFPGHPTIHAHARVTLQGEGSDLDVRPIAVSDPGSFACATVKFKNSFDNSTLGTAVLDETDPANFVFTNTGPAGAADGPVSFTMPNDLNAQGGFAYVYMQVILSDCNGTGETFDDTTNSGIEVIDAYGTAAPVSGEAPKVMNPDGVTLRIAGGGACGTATTNQYLSAGGCKVQPVADITFSPDVTNPNNQASVTATDTNTGNTLTLNPNGAGTVWTPNGNNTGFQIDDFTGQHLIRFDWSQKTGTVAGVTCTNQAPCTGSFGIQQQAFGECNGCDQPDDSGPIVVSQIRLATDAPGTFGRNAFQRNTATPPLIVTLQLAGVKAETNAGAKPVILRFSGSTNHQTGLVDCGQGNGPGGTGVSGDAYTIYGGCGPANPFEPAQCNTNGAGCQLPILNPLFVYGRGNPTNCSPAVDQDYVDWPAQNHQDCVETTPGTRRTGVVCGLIQRITGVTPANFQASSNACSSNIAGEQCPTNYWPAYDTLGPNDPRKIDVVLTSPLDLAAAAGSPQAWVPIRRFAKFYVTGWDTSLAPHCGNNGAPNNDPFPAPPGSKVSDNGAIWGHWITDVDPGGTPNGIQCDTSSGEPTNCVPALTR
jgi:hypothetical protein